MEFIAKVAKDRSTGIGGEGKKISLDVVFTLLPDAVIADKYCLATFKQFSHLGLGQTPVFLIFSPSTPIEASLCSSPIPVSRQKCLLHASLKSLFPLPALATVPGLSYHMAKDLTSKLPCMLIAAHFRHTQCTRSACVGPC